MTDKEYWTSIDEISLLVWLNRVNRKKLVETLCKYTGCDKEVYTPKIIRELEEKALSDISRKYFMPWLFFEYFSARREWQNYAMLSNTTYNDSTALESALLSIKPSVFDEYDIARIKELKEEYFKEEKPNEPSKIE